MAALKKKKKKKKGSEGKLRSPLFNNWSGVYTHPITASRLPDWWCKRLEGTEHIGTERGGEQPSFTSLGWIPNEKKNIFKKKNRGCFGSWTKKLPPGWSVDFGGLRGFQSFLEGPGWRVKTETRMIHAHICSHWSRLFLHFILGRKTAWWMLLGS